MFNVTWPEHSQCCADSLVTTFGGSVYRLVRSPFIRDEYMIYRDGKKWNQLQLPTDRKVADFLVLDKYIFVATESPAVVYLAFNLPWYDFQELVYCKDPIDHVSLGTYHGGLLILYSKADLTLHAMVLIGDNPFSRQTQALCLASEPGVPLQALPGERFICVPNMPRYYGVVAKLSYYGLRFYSLRPYYTLQPFSDTLSDVPLLYNIGDPALRGWPMRLRVNGYKLYVELEEHRLTFRYHLNEDFSTDVDDWISIRLNGELLRVDSTFVLTPKVNYKMEIEAKRNLEDVEICMNLPITISRTESYEPYSSVAKIAGLATGEKKYFNVRGEDVEQSINPQVIGLDTLGRFLDRLGMQVRASAWN